MAGLGIGIQIDDKKVQRMLTIAPQRIKAAKNEILNRGSIMTQAEMRINAQFLTANYAAAYALNGKAQTP